MIVAINAHLPSPAETQACPLLNDAVATRNNLLDSGADLLAPLGKVRWARKKVAKGLLLLRRVGREPAMIGVFAVQDVRDEDLILVQGIAAICENVGALVGTPILLVREPEYGRIKALECEVSYLQNLWPGSKNVTNDEDGKGRS